VDRQELQRHIDDGIEEQLQLEYKAAGSLGKLNDKTTEITKDVSAMETPSTGGCRPALSIQRLFTCVIHQTNGVADGNTAGRCSPQSGRMIVAQQFTAGIKSGRMGSP
jgi:hypothetical protein